MRDACRRIPSAIALSIGVLCASVGSANAQVVLPIPPEGDFDGDTITNEVECAGALSNTLRNGSFETPAIPAGTSRRFAPNADAYWQTTASDGQIARRRR